MLSYLNLSGLAGQLVALVAGLAAMQILLAIFKRRHAHQTFKRMNVVGPKPNFIHGHLYNTRRQPYVKFAHKMHEQYGKTVGIYMGGDPYLLTKDLDLIQQVFVAKSRIFYNRFNFYLNVDPVPDNLICQRGDRWRYMRKLLTPAFSTTKIKGSHLYRDTQQTVERLMLQLDQNCELVEADQPASEGQQVAAGQKVRRRETFVEDSYDRMAAVALDVIVKTGFHMENFISFAGSTRSVKGKQEPIKDKEVAEHKARSDKFLNTVKLAIQLGFNPIIELIFCFPFLDGPFTWLANRLYFTNIIKILFDRLDHLVRRDHRKSVRFAGSQESNQQQQQQQQVSELEKLSPEKRKRIVDSLVEVLRERKITRSEFSGNALVIVFAGFETTANGLTFTLWLLARHQAVQQKLRQELRKCLPKVRPGDYDRTLEDEELNELASGCDYLEMVINESLRLYPPVPGLSSRQASESCQLPSGLFLEKGVNVVPSVFSIHRDKSIWGQDAHLFRPERFEMLDVNQLNSAMFMPFGLGPRNCIGKALAMHEMKIVIGKLVLAYSLEMAPGKTPEKVRLCSPLNITITSADKIGLRFVKLEA